MKKRIISALLCILMLLTLLPAAVFASGSKISIVTVNVPYSPADGKEMFFDNSLITVGDPALYRAYLWEYSWTGPEGIYMPDEYNMPHFKGGERYTLMVLIVPEDGATGLDSSTAPFLPVYINGERARFNPACSPWLEEAPYKTTYAYEIDLQCPYTNEIDIVEIFGFTPPTPGAVPCDINDLSVPENAPYYIRSVIWERYNGDSATNGVTEMTAGETFTDGVFYYLNVTLCPYDGYTFSAGDVTWRINGTPYNGYADEAYSYISSPTAAKLYSADLKAEARHIDYIDIEGLGGFYEGAAAKTAFENVTAPDAEGYTLFFDEDTVISAESNNTYIDATDVFQSGETYRATFCARPDPGWTIDDSTVWRINGSTDLVYYALNSADYWFVKSIYIAPAAKTPIKEVYIYGYETPEVGQTAGDCLKMFVVGDLYELVEAYWLCDTDSIHMAETDTFEEGKLYSACVVVRLRDPSFTIDDAAVFYLNGGEFAVERSGARTNGDYYVWTEQMTPKTSSVTHTISIYLDADDPLPTIGFEVDDGAVYGLPLEPGREDFTFGGWYTDPTLTTPYDPTAPIYADTNLYAKWIPAIQIIPEISIDGFEEPRAGELPIEADALTVPEDAHYSISSLVWYLAPDSYTAESFTGPFVEGNAYFASICVTPDEGYAFADDTLVKINGLIVTDWFPFLDPSGDFCIDSPDIVAEGAPSYIPITAVNAQVPEPVVGQKPAAKSDIVVTSTPSDADITIGDLLWFYWDESFEPDGKWTVIEDSDYVFEADKIYAVNLYLYTQDDYGFDEAIDGTVNGEPSDTTYGDVYSNQNEVYLSYSWAAQETPCEHTNTELHNEKAATCTESGYSGDLYCFHCGQLLTKGKIIPALGHDTVEDKAVAPTCTQTGLTAGEHCTRCDYKVAQEEVSALGHDYVDGICSRCGAEDPNYVPPTPADPCEGYTDINRGSWYHKAADFVIANGYMGSMSKTELTFEPNTKVSRAMVASILYRICGSPAVEYSGKFTDVKEGSWYTKAIEWCAQNGLASGYTDGTFKPNATVSRQELAVFMYKLADHLGIDVSGRADLSGFADASSVPAWSEKFLQWAVSAGIVSGQANGGKNYLNPTAGAKRCEFASILMRFCDKFRS